MLALQLPVRPKVWPAIYGVVLNSPKSFRWKHISQVEMCFRPFARSKTSGTLVRLKARKCMRHEDEESYNQDVCGYMHVLHADDIGDLLREHRASTRWMIGFMNRASSGVHAPHNGLGRCVIRSRKQARRRSAP